MKKRIVALFIAVVLMLSLASCTKYSSVSVNGTKIEKGIYSYFADKARTDNPDKESAEHEQIARDSICEYVAINSEFATRGLSLTSQQKSNLSQTVNSYWRLFSTYYTDIGVSKQDLYKIEQNKLYRDCVMLNVYSEQGERPVSDDELKSYFYQNFIAFRVATGYLTTVNDANETVSLEGDARQTIINKFDTLSQDINSGNASLDSASLYYDNVTVTSDTVVINRNSTEYPPRFYPILEATANDTAVFFVLDDYVYTAQKSDITSEDFNFFPSYKADCIKTMKGEDFNILVSQWSEAYSVS